MPFCATGLLCLVQSVPPIPRPHPLPLPPAVCRQYVALDPANSSVAEASHWLLRQAAGTVLLGTRERLDATAAAASPAEQCTAVAWTLEVYCVGVGMRRCSEVQAEQEGRQAGRAAGQGRLRASSEG